MTASQRQWLIDNGLDPASYDVTPDGQIISTAVDKVGAVPAFMTGFAKSVLPTAAAIGSGALAGGAMSGPLAPVGAIVGGLAGGFAAGKAQDAALDAIAPEVNKYAARAQQDSPIASYLGGFAPNALALKPDIAGARALLNPVMGMKGTQAFNRAAINVGANVAGSTAGQLVDVAQGGEFSLPRFASDVALGSLFNNPTKLGQRLGLHVDPVTPTPERFDLSAAQEPLVAKKVVEDLRREGSDPNAKPVAETLTPDAETQTVKTAPDAAEYEKWWTKNSEPDTKLLSTIAKQEGLKLSKEQLSVLAEDPIAQKIMAGDYSRWPEWIAAQADEALESIPRGALDRVSEAQDPLLAAQMQAARKLAAERAPAHEEAADLRSVARERINQIEAEKAYPSTPTEPTPAPVAETKPEAAEKPKTTRALSKSQMALKVLKEELDSLYDQNVRHQREGAAGDQPLTQEQLNKLQDLAARRGIKVELKPIEGSNGLYVAEGNDVTITIDPLKATQRTLTEELGHDVYERTAASGVKKGLVEASMDTARYKAEVEALTKERAAGENKYTDAEIQAIAQEEGFIDTFTAAHPDVPPKDIVSWWQAFKGGVKAMAGMKMQPHEAMAWMNWAIHEGAPWGSSSRVSATRQQRTIDPLTAEIDKLAAQGPEHKLIADSYKASYNTKDFMKGQWGSLYEKAVLDLNDAQRAKLIDHLYAEQDAGARNPNVPADIKDAYDAVRKTMERTAQDAINAGHLIPGPNGYRQRGQDPSYFPAHRASADIREAFSRPERAGERAQLQADYLNYVSAEYLKKNPTKTVDQANAYAADKLEREIGIMQGKPQDMDASFAGASRPEGVPLPPSWRSKDLLDVMSNYINRSATDFAYKQHIESNPAVMAMGGHKTYINGAPIPQQIVQTFGGLRMLNEPSVAAVVREFNGIPNVDQGKVMSSASRVVSSAALAGVSKVTDTLSTLFKGLAYLPMAEWPKAVMDYAGKLADYSALAARSYESGLNRRDAAAQLKAITGTADMVAGKMDKLAEMLQKIQLLPQIEQFSRVLAQGYGELQIASAKSRAAAGNRQAAQFLDTLSPDWRTRNDLDLAAQAGRLLQGTYDMRSVPAWMLQGGAAPFLIWSKWSAGQYNNFKNYAIKPLMQGNAAPLIGQLLIGLAGGSAVGQIREWINGREDKDINWSELVGWLSEHQADADFAEAVTGKMVNTMQALGTFGFAGDLVKASLEPLNGGNLELPAHMPFGNFSVDLTKRISAALKALDEGEDAGEVLKAVALDVARSNVQLARAAHNWIDQDASMDANDKRRQKFFEVLSGNAAGGNTFAVSYSNVSDKAFDKAAPEDAATIAGDIIAKAAEGANSQDELKDRIRKLKTAQLGVMPNPDRNPAKAAEYLRWLEDSEPGAGVDAQSRFVTRQREAEYKKAMVSQMALGL